MPVKTTKKKTGPKKVKIVKRMNKTEATSLAKGIIEDTCMSCKEFYKDLRTSQCICEPIGDVMERESKIYFGTDGHPAVVAWENERKKTLGNLTADEKKVIKSGAVKWPESLDF